MPIESIIKTQAYAYPRLYCDTNVHKTKIKVLDEMFLSTCSSFLWDKDGGMYNNDLKGFLSEDFVFDDDWVKENEPKRRKKKWMPSPINEKSNITSIPNNVQEEFLEAAFLIAKESFNYLKNEDLSDYYLSVPKDVVADNVKKALKEGGEDDLSVPYHYRDLKAEGKLTVETALEYEKKSLDSKVRRMIYILEDFFERHKKIKDNQNSYAVNIKS